jgi:hypothetical protein
MFILGRHYPSFEELEIMLMMWDLRVFTTVVNEKFPRSGL